MKIDFSTSGGSDIPETESRSARQDALGQQEAQHDQVQVHGEVLQEAGADRGHAQDQDDGARGE